MKCIITVGISCSGKTTLANKLVKKGWVDINRDWVRFNVVFPGSDWTTYKFTKKRERDVTSEQEDMLLDSAQKGLNVIISDTNLNPNTREKWEKLCKENGYEVEIVPMPVSLAEAWKRDACRANGVGHQVIYKQYLQWLDFIGRKRYIPDDSLPKAILVDVDNTLTQMGNRSPFDWSKVWIDTPNPIVIEVVNLLKTAGKSVIILSGRDAVCKGMTTDWLHRNGITFDHIFMRGVGDSRKDTIIKEEIFWEEIADNYCVEMVIDDRPVVLRNWIEIGVKTFAVGNPFLEF